jgi:hypothetical protein
MEENDEAEYWHRQSEWKPNETRGIICNPIYAGIGPYPSLIEDKVWVRAASKAINEDGNEQFLINVLHLLRQSFAGATFDS